MTRLTHRAFTGALFSLVATLVAAPLMAAEKKKKKKKKANRPEWPKPHPGLTQRLQRDLTARVLPATGTALVVIGVYPTPEIGENGLRAIVEMHWSPGSRRRPIDRSGGDEEAAYAALLEATLDTFRAANPGAFS